MRVIACWALALTFVVSAAVAQEPLEKLTVNIRQVPLRKALKQMYAGSSFKYAVDPNVPDLLVNMEVREVHPATLLRLVVRAMHREEVGRNVCIVRENGVYHVKVDPALRAIELAQEDGPVTQRDPPIPVDAAFRDQKLAQTITRSFEKQALREIVAELFTGTGCHHAFSGKASDLVLSIELKNVTRLEGLRQLVAAAAKASPGLGLWRDGDAYVIGPKYWKARTDQP